jgi:hypothetical protein
VYGGILFSRNLIILFYPYVGTRLLYVDNLLDLILSTLSELPSINDRPRTQITLIYSFLGLSLIGIQCKFIDISMMVRVLWFDCGRQTMSIILRASQIVKFASIPVVGFINSFTGKAVGVTLRK